MSYVDITKPQFEAWLDSLGHSWELKAGTRGCYLLLLSDRVAVHITSTLGESESRGYAQASGQMRLVSRVTGKCLNRKAMGQKHLKRTSGWRKTWAKVVVRMGSAYTGCPGFYERIALSQDEQTPEKPKKPQEPEIVQKTRDAWRAAKLKGNAWEMGFLGSVGPRLKRGLALSEKQRTTLNKILGEQNNEQRT